MDVAQIGAVVLAGGASKRMGSDKAALEWNGESMLGRITRIVSERCDPVLVVAREGSPAYRGLGEGQSDTGQINWVTDEKPGAGPLGGLVTGLVAAAAAGRDVVFVCATDMPLVSAEMVDELLRGLSESDDAAIAVDSQRAHPLAGVYRTRASGILADLVASGERRMLAAVDALRTNRVTLTDPTWLTNVNAPEDLHRLRVP
ncbi:molybdopterin-guanine dinucleotide biosynthesis protein A [Williamsia limnetica]|uniref:Probable molybdenum cofactor guanylyltransferase n=1 Tax=Williamsia limnetica TaxID=882452 RepID=A0A318RQ96_WILLI|nr:molybdenum cofactor guanylyltransferase [Williamsia limnetica]PYE13993.1 molybdopterin-guanine dinucleotide biosynthesis protein A [Williamsia limnetica]